jgi:hypothetical protein
MTVGTLGTTFVLIPTMARAITLTWSARADRGLVLLALARLHAAPALCSLILEMAA